MTTIDLLNSTAPVRAFHLTTHLKSGYSVALLEQGLAHKTIKGDNGQSALRLLVRA